MSTGRRAVYISADHCHTGALTDKVCFRSKGYLTCCIDTIGSFAGNPSLLCPIIKACGCCVIHRYSWVTGGKDRFARLHQPFDIGRCRIFTYRSHLLNCWCVSRRHCRTVLIHTSDRDWIRRSDKLLVWPESNCAICCQLKDTDIRHFLTAAAVLKGRWNTAVQLDGWISSGEVWPTSLHLALLAGGCRIRCTWSDSCHCRLVGCLRHCSIHIRPADFDFCRLASESFGRGESDLAFGIHFKSTDIFHFFDIRTSVKDWCAAAWEANGGSARCESQLACLDLTLQAFCFSTCCAWSDSNHCRLIGPCGWCPIHIDPSYSD
ncbi:hypothetical protein STRDD11_01078 [Streptococcus sp. DD11]|nr:hypothetical protein STRDD11_01078 [Streptococcus sp. DD11]